MHTITITHAELALLTEGLRLAAQASTVSAIRGDSPAPRDALLAKAEAFELLAADLEAHCSREAA